MRSIRWYRTVRKAGECLLGQPAYLEARDGGVIYGAIFDEFSVRRRGGGE